MIYIPHYQVNDKTFMLPILLRVKMNGNKVMVVPPPLLSYTMVEPNRSCY
jgi:hypothetical protein